VENKHGEYAISKDGNAGTYLSIDPIDAQIVKTILNRLNIAHSKSSSIKDGENGKIYSYVINIHIDIDIDIDIDSIECDQLQKELNVQFP